MNPIFPFLSAGAATLLLCVICMGAALPVHPHLREEPPKAEGKADAKVRLKALLAELCTPETCPPLKEPDAAPLADAS